MHYYQFNIGDYASHTRGLELLEDLAYRRIIDEYYLAERPLNGRSTDVARLIGMAAHEKSVEYVLTRFFTEVDGSWVHERIEKEIAEFKAKQENSVKAGKASAESRRNKGSGTGVERTLNGRSTVVQPTNNHKPITNNQSKPPTPSGQVAKFAVPDWIDAEAWAGYVDMRKRIKKPLTERAIGLAVLKLDQLLKQGHDPKAVLDQSVMNSWQGLFEIKGGTAKSTGETAYQRNMRNKVAEATGGLLATSDVVEALDDAIPTTRRLGR